MIMGHLQAVSALLSSGLGSTACTCASLKSWCTVLDHWMKNALQCWYHSYSKLLNLGTRTKQAGYSGLLVSHSYKLGSVMLMTIMLTTNMNISIFRR